jgi:hypothetical protein
VPQEHLAPAVTGQQAQARGSHRHQASISARTQGFGVTRQGGGDGIAG